MGHWVAVLESEEDSVEVEVEKHTCAPWKYSVESIPSPIQQKISKIGWAILHRIHWPTINLRGDQESSCTEEYDHCCWIALLKLLGEIATKHHSNNVHTRAERNTATEESNLQGIKKKIHTL